jgi:DNA transformation protein
MAASPGFRDHILELLAALGPVIARAMFGGYGLYLDGRMFALICNGALYI